MQRKKIETEIYIVAEKTASIIESFLDTETQIKNSSWTIGDTAAHVIISVKLFSKILEGGQNPYKIGQRDPIAEINEKLLNSFPKRNGKILAQMLRKDIRTFLQIINRYPLNFTVKTHFGKLDLITCLSYFLSHLLIHGCTIAINLKKDLPIEEKHVAMTQIFLNKAALQIYDKNKGRKFYATVLVRLRNSSEYAIICKGSHITITDDIPNDVDCIISVDPVSYFLISTGVINQWQPLLQGKIFISGKKPWLALNLIKLFNTP
jgi:putative sterol carrier protein